MFNKVILCGNLGADVESRTTPNGFAVASLSLATSKTIKGEKKTQWHRVSVWGEKQVEWCANLMKGDKVLLEGELIYSNYEQNGVKKTSSEIHTWGYPQRINKNKKEKSNALTFKEKSKEMIYGEDIPF